jgi:hypothetical protein
MNKLLKRNELTLNIYETNFITIVTNSTLITSMLIRYIAQYLQVKANVPYFTHT